MGIIRQQTIKGTVVSYIGAILGLVNTGILFPKFFATDQIGLILWLGAITTVAAQFSSLGFNNVTARLFPYFRNENVNHNGYLFILFWVGMAGFMLSLISYFILQPVAVNMYSEESPLYLDYLIYLIPLVFFTLFYNLFEGYNRVMYDAVSGTIFRDIVFKLLNLSFILLFVFEAIDFSQFVFYYVLAYCSPTVFLFMLLWWRGQISFASNLKFITPELRKSITSVSLFGIMNGLSDKLANQIDRIMIVSYIGLGANGIFGIMAYFGVLVSMPARSLRKISSTVIAEAWKRNDLSTISQIYSQSGLHQFMLGCLLFIGIWVNIDNVFEIVSDKFVEGRYVVFLIGLAHVIQMLSGVSGVIIQSSPYYKMQTVFMGSYSLLVIVSNAIMIPIWGINGAAFASLLSTLIFNLAKYLFLYRKYQLQPLNKKYLLVILISLIAYFSGYFLPRMDSYLVDIVLRSSLVGGLYVSISYALHISTDFNKFVKKQLKF
ncbi:polysaccharide biosynthesis C-terminal domain-containing protein [Labilibaculum sp. DW002]|uniref:Polysaccharide biosynthesis C-terminal domain-containing protein n=1 Tax=Paralabilibaculum antarcticum TaxID=2912572 RepID=A0ABT5VTA6_9BACT|nr:polysaccharide biosynthesis C-terminal domain-containing protein [Labilibaculum sp. DW002]MDE5418646.1 polysaccharide biosynthesis C-terminal domain-containing protein [Labilibaculum sp. DW002]